MASTLNIEERPSSPRSSDLMYAYQMPPFSRCRGGNEGESCKVEPEPMRLLSSGSLEQDSLMCNEDGSSLEPLQNPVHREPPGTASAAPVAAFDVADVGDAIRSDLIRLQELRYVPESPAAMHFANDSRPRVVSWLVQVVSALDLNKETLHSAVSLLDRFIVGTEAQPPENMLQLLALGCLSAAAKHEEVEQRSSDDWVALAVGVDGRNMYERVDLHRMEWLLLETVEWRIRVPNALTFLRQYYAVLMSSGVIPEDPAYANLFRGCAEFMVEMSLLYTEFLSFGYSTIAVASLTLADWCCQSVFATNSHHPVEASPGARRLVVLKIAAVLGLDADCLTPQLSCCMNNMTHLYRLVNGWGPWGLPPDAEELGLLAPVVARYRKVR